MPAARHRRLFCCAAACLLTVLSPYARGNANQASSPLSAYEHAEELHRALESQPEAQRSQRDYERVLDAYRAVYHGDPGSAKADASVSAVADLLAEDGRVFQSQKAFHDALGQYEFLRHQYPYSRYRFAALIAEGEIYRTGLADRDHAKAEFEEFLKMYPRHPLAEQAREGLGEIREEEAANRPSERVRIAEAPERIAAAQPPKPTPERSQPEEGNPGAIAPAATALTAANPREAPAWDDLPAAAIPSTSDGPEDNSEASSAAPGRLTRVTGIRYWSSPSDTRIAIDLEDQVKYGAAQIPRPNRVYFDLRGTVLAPGLKAKSIVVGDDAMLTRIRAAQFSDDVTRIVLDVGAGVDYTAFFLPNPWRLIIDIHSPKADAAAAPLMEAANRVPVSPVQTPPAQGAPTRDRATSNHVAQGPEPPNSAAQGSRTARESALGAASRSSSSRNELASIVLLPATAEAASTPPGPASLASPIPTSEDSDNTTPYGEEFPAARESVPTADRDRSLARTLGLKVGRIVIDAGHGGHDCGTLGPGGIEEKDVTLDVALRLGRLLKSRLGADVIYTRRDDTFVALQERTAIANEAHADLFISIHANSSSDSAARGVESYYLNFTTAPDALEVAARENAVSNESVSDLSDLVKEIALKDKIEESREFAVDVQRSLYNGLELGNPGFKNRGVKNAPFVVLIGANMPSILAEISFLTNPDDARELRQSAYRERIAEALYRGVSRYISGLNGVRLAENGAHPSN